MMPRYYILRVLLILALILIFYNFVLYGHFFKEKHKVNMKNIPESIEEDLKPIELDNENLPNEQQQKPEQKDQHQQQQQQALLPENLPKERPKKQSKKKHEIKQMEKSKESDLKAAQDDFVEDRAPQDIAVKRLKRSQHVDQFQGNAPESNLDNVAQDNLPKDNDQNNVNNVKNRRDDQRGVDDQHDNQIQNEHPKNAKRIQKNPQIEEQSQKGDRISNPNPLKSDDRNNFNLPNADDSAKVFVQHYEHDYEQNIKVLTNCKDKSFEPRMYQRGIYWVLENYVRANHGELRCTESLTFVTQGDYSFIDNLIPVLERWQGPVSMALYSPGDDFKPTIDSINYARKCLPQSELVRKFATFHIFFDANKHFPKIIPEHTEVIDENFDCNRPAPYANVKSDNLYKNRVELLYPVNVARNIARDATLTHFLLVCDIELYPSPELPQKFLQMIARNQPPLNSTKPRVFPLPIFEVHPSFNVPETKTELQRLYRDKKLIIFHASFCAGCHKVPSSDEWVAAKETEDLSVFKLGKRIGTFRYWEPIFIGTNNEPYYDERLSWEGKSDKMTQSRIMCIRDYEYFILDNAFLVHRPGIKKFHEDSKRKSLVKQTNNLLDRFIYPHIKILYKDHFGC